MFDRFRRRPRYNPELGMAAAALLSEEIVRAALRASKELKNALGSEYGKAHEDESLGWQTVFEFMFFFLHIADRLSFQVLEPQNRGSFMDDLASMTFATMAEVFLRSPDENLQGELKRSLLASLNRRNTDYGSCQKLLPEKDEGAKGTLFWEFGKVIAETQGRPKDVIVIMTATSVGLAALKMLDLKAALQRTFD